MASVNRVVLVGRLVRQPELRITPGGTSVSAFTIAVDRRKTRDGDGTTDFIDCVTFGKLAEVAAKYCDKGQQVAVDGRLQTRSWQDKDGGKRKTVEVIVENLQFLARPKTRDDEAPEYE